MSRIIIAGKHLELREIVKGELPILLQWRNSEVFRKHCIATNTKITLEELDLELTNGYKFDRFAHFIAWDKNNNPIGTNWIYRFDKINGTAYTTTFVDENYRNNRFYGIDMFLMTCKYLFENYDIRKIYSEVHSNNKESKSIFEKLQLPLEAQFKEHSKINQNQYIDLCIYALYRHSFDGSRLVRRILF